MGALMFVVGYGGQMPLNDFKLRPSLLRCVCIHSLWIGPDCGKSPKLVPMNHGLLDEFVPRNLGSNIGV